MEKTETETKDGKVQAKNFSFAFCKGIRPAFEKAVTARHDFEIEHYGETIIRLDKMDEYWELAEKNYGDKIKKWL